MELEGMTKACRAKVIMKSPVTSTAAMEAMNSGVVSLGFLCSPIVLRAQRNSLAGFLLDCQDCPSPCRDPSRHALVRNPEHAVPAQALERLNGTVCQSRKFTRPSIFAGFQRRSDPSTNK